MLVSPFLYLIFDRKRTTRKWGSIIHVGLDIILQCTAKPVIMMKMSQLQIRYCRTSSSVLRTQYDDARTYNIFIHVYDHKYSLRKQVNYINENTLLKRYSLRIYYTSRTALFLHSRTDIQFEASFGWPLDTARLIDARAFPVAGSVEATLPLGASSGPQRLSSVT